jgi:hypothetical protein
MLQPSAVGRSSLAAIVVAPALALSGHAAEPTRILAIGDFGVGGSTQTTMGAAVRTWEEAHPAHILVTLGDNDYTEDPDAFHDNWTASFGWLQGAGVDVAGTLGNHDVRVDGGRYEFDELGMPRWRYRRVVGNVELFLLNSNNVGSARQRDWLRVRLRESTATWKIVAFHHPAFTCGPVRARIRRGAPPARSTASSTSSPGTIACACTRSGRPAWSWTASRFGRSSRP